MKYMRFFRVAPVLLVFLSGCSAETPYVYKSSEFSRKAQELANQPKDIDFVAVCYSKNGTTPQVVSGLARDECAKYNKLAVYNHQDYLLCPITTPVAAYFKCVPDKSTYR